MAKKKLYNRSGIVFSTAPDFNFPGEKDNVESLTPDEQFLKIKLDKKHRGGKVVTIVEGLSMNEVEIENISKQLKTFCGTGGSAKNYEIIIQGDHREKIVEWFIKKGFLHTKKI